MNFASDNWAGASPAIMQAIADASSGLAPAYGQDDLTREVKSRLADFFGHDVGVVFTATGTSANSLCLSALCPPYGAVYAHQEAHIIGDEGGACEFITQGAKLIGIAGISGKITAASLVTEAARGGSQATRLPVPATVSVTQATECGTVYRPDELYAIGQAAHSLGLNMHMDGARFANAMAFLKKENRSLAPADITWKSGIDALSLGFTKNGALMAEAVVMFDPARADVIEWKRKRSGQVMSKVRPIAAQFLAMLNNDHWFDLASHANMMAAHLAEGLTRAGYRIGFPVEANEVFAILPATLTARLRQDGARFYEWPTASLPMDRRPADGEDLVRLVTSFATKEEHVTQFIRRL